MNIITSASRGVNTSVIEKYDSFLGTVVKETVSGCILLLELENGETTPAFAFGNYATGNRLMVTVTKIFDDGRYSRVSVDTIVSYASDLEYVGTGCSDAA